MARGKNSRKRAGAAGGEATKAKHGASFYQEIGAKGGASKRKSKRGSNNGSSDKTSGENSDSSAESQ